MKPKPLQYGNPVAGLNAENERLRAVLAATAERLDNVAGEIPPPNEFTPRLMMIAIGIRNELKK